jgi:hypothetical protein
MIEGTKPKSRRDEILVKNSAEINRVSWGRHIKKLQMSLNESYCNAGERRNEAP